MHAIVEDRLADRDAIVAAAPLAIVADPRDQLLAGRVDEHDATTVGFDPIENQPHDPVEQLVDIERVAHGQGRTVHHLQVIAAVREPHIGRNVGFRVVQVVARLVTHRADDARAVVGLLPGDNIDFLGDVAFGEPLGMAVYSN